MTTLLTGRLQASSRELFIQLEVTVHPVKQLESVGSCRVASTWSHSESSGTHASTGSRSESSGTQHFASTGISKSSHSVGLQPEFAVSCRVAETGTPSVPSGTLASTGTRSEPSGTQHFASTGISMTSFSLRHQPESAVSCRVASTGTPSEPSGTLASTGTHLESSGKQHFASTGISMTSHSVGLQPESAVSCRVASTGTH